MDAELDLKNTKLLQSSLEAVMQKPLRVETPLDALCMVGLKFVELLLKQHAADLAE